ncbi:hypothetical protein [Euzebya sp.]|uniref:hypothetical protein n=1 Tax=Euzebya sp. TaxID=1971409 RepID=UPI003513C958
MGASIEIFHPGWMIGDGEPVPTPGEVWTAMVEVQRRGATTPSDWHPHVEAASVDGEAEFEAVPPWSATYRFTCSAVAVVRHWTILDCDGLHLAIPGSFPGGVTGTGRFVHDTYFVTPDVRDVLRSPFLVDRVRTEGENLIVTGQPVMR